MHRYKHTHTRGTPSRERGGFFARFFRRARAASRRVIAPDEVLIDARNLASLDFHQFEGRMERPLSGRAVKAFAAALFLGMAVFAAKLADLQITHGAAYAAQGENNRLNHTLMFADRGVITDRTGRDLAWNSLRDPNADFARREYTDLPGLSAVLGYVGYPTQDAAGFYFEEDYVGKDGAELVFNETLRGVNGLRIVETDALGAVRSSSVVRAPRAGGTVALALDARVQSAFSRIIEETAEARGFASGAGALMDTATGELLAAASYPSYDSQMLTNERDPAALRALLADPAAPFVNRASAGLYAPGSIMKPFLALAALEEGIIDPRTVIVSTGALVLPNPFNPDRPSVFRDWRAHGPVDMRRALAVSSDVYFYQIGGGFGGQAGLGIERIEAYLRKFGFAAPTGVNLPHEEAGVIPTPEWKAERFAGEPWRIGDTYNTAIGQYGVQITPLQAVRATAALANNGSLLTPTIRKSEDGVPAGGRSLALRPDHFEIVREGMRDAVRYGTAVGLSYPDLAVAAKTGTAEVGVAKRLVNSWIIGFFPYEQPRYAFAALLERGPAENLIGGVSVMRRLLDWMRAETPEYLSPRSFPRFL